MFKNSQSPNFYGITNHTVILPKSFINTGWGFLIFKRNLLAGKNIIINRNEMGKAAKKNKNMKNGMIEFDLL